MRQQGRPVRVRTELGGDKLVVERMVAEEYVSAPYRISLDLLSDDPGISTKSMLRTSIMVEMDIPDGVRCLHGQVARFAQVGRELELTRYRAEVVPSLWFLTLGMDNRIFQQKSVTEIAEDVLTKAGVKTLSLKTTKTYEKREYCVQYGESNFAFVSRLLEDEGIFYLFRHEEDDHELILADGNSVFSPCPGAGQVRFTSKAETTDGDVILGFQRESAVHPGVVTLRDYNYLEPSANLERSEGQRNEEVYRFPGGYVDRNVGGTRAKLRLDAAEALEQMVHGSGTARGLTAGGRFQLRDHWDGGANIEYYLLSVRHFVTQGGWHANGQESFTYGNEFTAVPFSVPYLPQQVTPAPRMHGTQTAVVVGKAGEEIYTDPHGRVKVQFHWDREGKKNENSSCWVRVSSAWAGKGYGSLQLPRIGQEVIVDFLEGDPDRPIITGRVFNAEQAPPCDPGGKGGVISGFRTKTHKGSGYNEMTLDDTAGKEKITIHAQYDMDTTVQHDDTQTVKNHRTVKITEGNFSHDVVAGTSTSHVKGAVVENYDATQATTVKNDITIVSQSGPIAVKADSKNVLIQGTTDIEIKVGSSKIKMDAAGQISIEGVNVTIKGSAALTLKGGMVTSQADAQHQTKGAIVMSEGSATNTIKGGMVMLNP